MFNLLLITIALVILMIPNFKYKLDETFKFVLGFSSGFFLFVLFVCCAYVYYHKDDDYSDNKKELFFLFSNIINLVILSCLIFFLIYTNIEPGQSGKNNHYNANIICILSLFFFNLGQLYHTDINKCNNGVGYTAIIFLVLGIILILTVCSVEKIRYYVIKNISYYKEKDYVFYRQINNFDNHANQNYYCKTKNSN